MSSRSAVRGRKVTIYLRDELAREIQAEAERQDRPLSWILQQAWIASRAQLQRMPAGEAIPNNGG